MRKQIAALIGGLALAMTGATAMATAVPQSGDSQSGSQSGYVGTPQGYWGLPQLPDGHGFIVYMRTLALSDYERFPYGDVSYQLMYEQSGIEKVVTLGASGNFFVETELGEVKFKSLTAHPTSVSADGRLMNFMGTNPLRESLTVGLDIDQIILIEAEWERERGGGEDPAPVDPVDPEKPVGPEKPTIPVDPEKLVDPVDPVDPETEKSTTPQVREEHPKTGASGLAVVGITGGALTALGGTAWALARRRLG